MEARLTRDSTSRGARSDIAIRFIRSLNISTNGGGVIDQ